MSFKKIVIIGFIISLSIPVLVSAQIKISEIMYDPQGSDTKREWIEVFNSGAQNIDLSTYFLFENNVHHKLTAQTSSILTPGTFAIIADSIPEVLADFSGYSGLMFDSAFSLNNTGESISISNPQKEILDTFIYSSDMGANNTGQSLQINDTAVIVAGATFGSVNKTESEVLEVEATSTASTSDISSNSSNDSSHSQQVSVSNYVPATSFKVGAGRDRTVSVNTPIEFEGYISKSDIRATYAWNFGDFDTGTGRKDTHIYTYPGIYEVVLEGKSKAYTSVSRTQVQVVEPQLSILEATSTITIINLDSKELNLGGFRFIFNEGSLVIPRNTIIRGKGSITLAKDKQRTLEAFEYPNKKVYQSFVLPE